MISEKPIKGMMTLNNIGSEQEKELILKALYEVKDPEISSISIVDLGMMESTEVVGNTVKVQLVPTFLGCTALDIIRQNTENAIKAAVPSYEVQVEFIHHIPWTSDRISEEGRERLKEFGIAPPPRKLPETGIWEVDCPYCGSPYTTLENLFGPAACRSILYCKSCRNPFEAMKPLFTNI